jgi:hypothetical protein
MSDVNNPAVSTGEGSSTGTTHKTEADVLADDSISSNEEGTSRDEGEALKPESEDVTSDDDEDKESKGKDGDPSDELDEPDDEEFEEKDDDEKEEDEDDFDDSEITRPSWKFIKENHPELAKNKDFREMYHSERAYREVFPTVQEAKEAANASEAFSVVADDLADGNMKAIFKDLDDEILTRMSENFLPHLFEHNPKFFKTATEPVIVNLLHNIHSRAVKDGDENLRKSVRNISKALTGSFDLPNRKDKVSPEVESERKALKEEKQRIFQEKEFSFLSSLDDIVEKRLVKIASDGLDKIEGLSDFARDAIIERAVRDVKLAIKEDENLARRLANLHRQAGRSDFPKEIRSRMAATYLERARRIIANAREKHLEKALGRTKAKSNGKEKVTTKEDVTTKSSRGVESGRAIDTSKTSAEDFLHDRNVHFKE